MAANVSARDFRNDDVTDMVEVALQDSGLAPDRLELEITETALVEQHGSVVSTLSALASRGIGIALDDFGEGSSNLNLFQDLHPDFLKISGTFSRGLAHDPFKQIIVQSTAEMAARAGTATVMEAVETAEDAEVLRLLGIDYAQGYFFQRPLPGRELAQLLKIGSTSDRSGVLEPLGAASSSP